MTDRPIHTLLIANRGEIVRRVARTAHAMGIRTVAVHSDPDSASPHVRACDIAIPLGGTTSAESYLDADKVLAAARLAGADAIHPGYGFLSEDPGFAEACADQGLTWVGPAPKAMVAMADKVRAKEEAMRLGVPLLPGAVMDGDDPDRWRTTADAIGWPLLVKASAGGGGKGMRVVEDVSELAAAVDGARREAAASFGDGTVFVERYLRSPRHVEVQVFGDEHGRVVHLFERECSIQRRHQKVIEEAPSPGVDEALRTRLSEAAVRLASGIGYVGAGTVEFLVDGGELFFLEMNTRLQVEHPVTEAILGLDLVHLQLEVAQGAPLPASLTEVVPYGHAIEARLYAEDVPAGFLPSPGTLHRWSPAAIDGVRYDSAVEAGTVVSPYYDPMVAKVIAHAPTRREAALRLARTLEQTRIGGLITNRDLLVAVLRHDAFQAGDTTTAFLDDHPEVLTAGPPPALRRAAAVAAALAAQHVDRPRAAGLEGVPSGWRNMPSSPQSRTLDDVEVTYRFTRDGIEAMVDGDSVPVAIHELSGTGADIVADLTVDGVRRRFEVAVIPDPDGARRLCASAPDGHVEWLEPPRFIDARAAAVGSGPMSPLPGTVAKVAVTAGDTVSAGQMVAVVEAMKMEHTITAEVDAVVDTVLVAEGDRVDAHQVLLTYQG